MSRSSKGETGSLKSVGHLSPSPVAGASSRTSWAWIWPRCAFLTLLQNLGEQCLPLVCIGASLHAWQVQPAPTALQIADLSLPVAVCEPVTDMQRRGDFLEYVELLHEVNISVPQHFPSPSMAVSLIPCRES